MVAERRERAFSRDLNSLGPGFLVQGGLEWCLDPEMIDDPLPGVSPHKIPDSPQPPGARGGVSDDARMQFFDARTQILDATSFGPTSGFWRKKPQGVSHLSSRDTNTISAILVVENWVQMSLSGEKPPFRVFRPPPTPTGDEIEGRG